MGQIQLLLVTSIVRILAQASHTVLHDLIAAQGSMRCS